MSNDSLVKVEHKIRTGLGNEYYESYYYCPSCKKILAYHNGITLIEGTKSENFCPNCGVKLKWPDPEKEQKELDSFYKKRNPLPTDKHMTLEEVKEYEKSNGLVREMFGNNIILVPKEEANPERVEQYKRKYEKENGKSE